MYIVYPLRSLADPARKYTGFTTDLPARLIKHNEGGSPHTAKHRPWRLVAYFAFESEATAIAFERYLKSGSGRAFAEKRFWRNDATQAETDQPSR